MSENLGSIRQQVEQMNKVASGEIQPQPQPQSQSHQFPTEVIDLPSKGLAYPPESPLSSGQIEMRYMTAKDEDILSTETYIKKGIVLDKLFKSLIVTPGVNYNDLLLGDKNAIMLAARIYGYGPEYETVIKTPSGKELPITINLEEVPHKEFDESLIIKGQNLFEFTLPRAKNKIKFSLLTVGLNDKIDQALQGVRKLGRVATADANLTTRLRYMIREVDGNADLGYIKSFVENMLAVDSRAFREYISKIQPDIDLNVEMEDPDTGETFRNNFEIGVTLFYPDYEG